MAIEHYERAIAEDPEYPLGYAGLAPIATRALPAAGPFAILGESFSGPLAIAVSESGGQTPFVLGCVPQFASLLCRM